MTLKFENTAEVGDIIKAFDFPPMLNRPDRFVIGKVVSKGVVNKGFAAYTVKVTNDCHETCPGEHVRVGLLVYVPFEVAGDEYDDRVTKVNP